MYQPEGQIIRRNIHTYPFKYRYVDYDDYFRRQSAVLYLHVPFCIKKCGFCDYTVYVNKNESHFARYVDALEKEIRNFATNRTFPGFSIDAVYFGGGTPGILTGEQLVRLLDACRETFEFNDGCEIALEFDPSTVDPHKVETLVAGGFNRVNVGVQAFDDRLLEICNRSHDVATAENAYRMVVDGGFRHTNIDLIFPLPDQSLDDWKRSVDRAIELEPACITAYGLEIWPKTAFHTLIGSGKMQLPSPAEEAMMYEYAIDALEAAGFRRRSSTGYFHPDRCPDLSRFLEYYWRTWPMIGFGVSSKSVIHDRLYVNVQPLKRYYEMVDEGRIPIDFATVLTKEQEMRRVMIRGLKMCEVSQTEFLQRFGVPMESVFGSELQELVDKDWLRLEGDRYELTRAGQLYSTNVYEMFYTREDLSPADGDEVRFGISELME
ncbi:MULTISPECIES: coproporphyrinogen-III oxidase family protein [Micromonospora]|uniref:Heme chaperone HemW n=1 Tax=Micromonospora antibiotica TaxID=2807623 RepID=A0ABS3V3D3_9ACTN|nr:MULTISPECIES: coproporphyrinogen-III oxidase family protein [Micromonospora]MBO4160120.1 coproporphyrinogen III oxidase family protein [Micromonospora antibiotica]MBW4704658.1 coproporphyrinogen III oxidase family protein [Micromonospora sp. RL09-050-HVF-A]